MGKEIERRFLVHSGIWQERGRPLASARHSLRQGFLSTVKERVVRVRVVGDCGFLTIKGLTHGCTKAEFEYPIPLSDANQLLDALCEPPLIEKIRYLVPHAGLFWEVDEFLGLNQGLVLAEVELLDEQQPVSLPEWVAQEVSADPRYFNSNLSRHPFNTWQEEDHPS